MFTPLRCYIVRVWKVKGVVKAKAKAKAAKNFRRVEERVKHKYRHLESSPSIEATKHRILKRDDHQV